MQCLPFMLLQLFSFLSCSDATVMQTPFPPADSVGSLRRCGLGVLVAGEEEEECEAPTSSPASLSHAREKSWLIVSTMAPCTLSHSTTNHPPRQHSTVLFCCCLEIHVMYANAQTYDMEQRNGLFGKPH